MTTDRDIKFRLDRLYAALKMTRDETLKLGTTRVMSTDKFVRIEYDFCGGASEAELANSLHETIERIVSLRDFLRNWAERNGKDASQVNRVFESPELDTLRQVWNSDKHIEQKQHLRNFDRGLQLTASGDKPATWIGGQANGDVAIVTTADIHDRNGNYVAPVTDYIKRGLSEIEQLCKNFGIQLSP